jgi:hypothetical protein
MACVLQMRTTVCSLFIVFLAGTLTANASDPVCPEPATAPASGQAGLQVYLDPNTGELLDQPPPGQPTLAEVAAEAPAQARPELVEEVRPDGSVRIRLDDRFNHPLVAEINEGEVVTCHRVSGAESRDEQP